MSVAPQLTEVRAEKPQTQAKQPPPKTEKEIRCEVLPRANYSEWDDLVNRSPHGTPFHYSWWLDATAGNFEILAVRNERGVLAGGMPVPFQRRQGLNLVHSPALTRYLGPVFDLSPNENTCGRLHLMRSLGELLASNVKAFDSFRCLAGTCAPDLQGFLWAGFAVRLAYTFRFPASRTLEDIIAGMTQAHLQELKRVLRLDLTVTRDQEINALLLLSSRNPGARSGSSPEILRKLWEAARSRNHADLYVARSAGGKPLAALLTARDSRTTYQILVAEDPDSAEISAPHLVFWTALQDCIQAGRDFEFESATFRDDESYYRRWGAAAVPIWRLEKTGSWRGGLLHSWKDRRESISILK